MDNLDKFEFTDNMHRWGGFVKWMEDTPPKDKEICYWITLGGATPTLNLVRVADEGQAYDGGRSGKTWFGLVHLGPVTFGTQGPLLPGDAETRNGGLGGSAGLLLRRTLQVDTLVQFAVALLVSWKDEEKRRKDLEESLKVIFGDRK